MANPKDHKHKASHKSGASFGSNRQFEEDRKLRSAGEKPEPEPVDQTKPMPPPDGPPPESTPPTAESVTAALTPESALASSASSGSTSSVEASALPATPEATASSAVPVGGAETDASDPGPVPGDVVEPDEPPLRSPDYPGRVVSEVVSRRGWNKPRDVVELLERQAKASHGAVADVQLMKDVAEWLRLESGLDPAPDDDAS